MKNTNIRNAKIDIIRALCIISIVMGHCGFPFFKFTCRFQTSLFFIISGYFWKVEIYSKRSIRDFTIHKFKTLWVPYVVWNSIFMLLNNFFCKVGIYTTKSEVFSEVSKVASLYGIHEFYTFRKTIVEFLKILLFMGGTELGGASWFFRILFLAEMGIFVSFYILKKFNSNILLLALIVASSSLGHVLVYQQELIFGRTSFVIEQIGLIFFAYSLIVTGIMLKKLEYAYEIFLSTNKGAMFVIVVGLLVSCLMYYSKISIWQENYGVMVALFAWMFLWGQAYFIDRYLRFVKNALIYLGKNTVPVFMGHFAVFKIVNIVVANLEGYPFYYISAFPTLGRWNPYGICYTVAGVIIPLFIAYMYNIFRRTYGLKDIN